MKGKSKKIKKRNNNKATTIKKPSNYLLHIKSNDVLRILFSHIPHNLKLKIIKKNKGLQNKIGISIHSYIIMSTIQKSSKNSSFSINDIIYYFEILKDAIPNIDKKELAQVIWDYYSWKNLIFYTLNHESLQYFLPLIKFSQNKKIESIEIKGVYQKENYYLNELNYIGKELLHISTSFSFSFLKNKKLSQKDLSIFSSNLNYIRSSHNVSGPINLEFSGFSSENNFDSFYMEILEKCAKIKHLDLHNNLLNEKSFKNISNKINLSNLKILNLSDNQLKDNDLISIANNWCFPQVEVFNISKNMMTNSIITAISMFMKNIKQLNVSNNLLNSQCFLYLIEKKDNLTNLVEIDLSKNQIINIANVKLFLSNYSSLISLELLNNFTNITKDEVKDLMINLSSLSNLKKLSLSGLNFEKICNPLLFPSLSNLQLSSSINIHKLLQNLPHNILFQLVSLNLEDSIISNNQINIMKECFENLANLKELNISNCEINMELFSPSLKSLIHIEKLFISNNIWKESSILNFSNILSLFINLNTFDISSSKKPHMINPSMTKFIILSLLKCTKLENLNFSHLLFDYESFDYLFVLIRKNENLSQLSLRNTSLSNENLFSLLKNNKLLLNLTMLNIGQNPIDDNCLNSLFQIKDKIFKMNCLNLSQIRFSKETKSKLIKEFGTILLI